MADLLLQPELTSAVIRLANTASVEPDEVVALFEGSWVPDKPPGKAYCRRVQRELRDWLLNPSTDLNPWPVVFMVGFDVSDGRKHGGIKLEGRLGCRQWLKDDGSVGFAVKSNWFIREAPLRSMAALGVAFIHQAGDADRVLMCKRDGCENIFIRPRKKGPPQEYCKTDECDLARNRESTAKTRSKQ